VGPLLALLSAVLYGMADFAGGVLSRRADFVVIAVVGQGAALVLTAVTAPLVSPGAPAPADLGWGALSGVGSAVGMVFLYRGLSRGDMSVVVPVSAVGGLVLPILVGVAVLGERPSPLSWAGIVLAVPALWLVARPAGAARSAATVAALDGLLASAGFAVQYLALAQPGPGAGIWPVTAGRLAATVTALALAVRAGKRLRLRPAHRLWAAACGAVAAAALVCYLLATREDLLVVAVVLSNLYPVMPVLLGVTVLCERLSPRQVAGLAAAMAAVVMITAG
jgi:drug/metabolite transporter (DMT)-like permease